MKNKINDEYSILLNQFLEPYFQPIIDINTGSCVGIEVLPRLVSTEHTNVNHFPEFLAGYAEQCKTSHIMLRKVIAQLRDITFSEDFKSSDELDIYVEHKYLFKLN